MPSPSPEPPADDAVIARALRRSLAVLLVLAVSAGAVVLGITRRPAPPAPQQTALAAPLPAAAPVPVPTVKFTDVTTAAGITFRHSNGARGEKLLPETMGGGVAWIDFDADGDPDLLFINSTSWPDDPRRAEGRPSPTLSL